MEFKHHGHNLRAEAVKMVVAENDLWHPKLWIDGSVLTFNSFTLYPPKSFNNEEDAIEYAAEYGKWIIDHPPSSGSSALDELLEEKQKEPTIRCLVCGSSRLDPEGYKCADCGGAPGLRTERCYVSNDTKAKLLAHADELKSFGVTVEQHEILGKQIGTVEGIGLALAVADSLRHGSLRDLVLFLKDIAIPEEQVLRLRLDEPEPILTYYGADKPSDERGEL